MKPLTKKERIIKLRFEEGIRSVLKFPKPKKVKRTTLKKKADKLFSAIVRRLGRCELMGLDTVHCGGVLQCAHIETRGVYGLRWQFQNALCICSGHHVYYTYHEKAWQELIEKHFPAKWKFYLKHKNDHLIETYEEVIQRLEAI